MPTLTHREKWQIVEDLKSARTAFQQSLKEQYQISNDIDHLIRKELVKHRPTTKIYDQIKAKIRKLEEQKWEVSQRQKELEPKMDELRQKAIKNRLIGFD